VPHLDQLQVQAVEWRIEADLHDGRHEQLIPQLRELTARHPVREHFHGQLMLALYRGGRQAEALAAYQHARQALVDELGIEPGGGLRDLHNRILAGDTELLLSRTPPLSETPPPSARPPSVPRQLPAAVRHFVGRAAELKSLSELLAQQAEAGGAVVISAVGGTAGVGKTALAVHWAQQHSDRFPDGQLYVNLRGFDPAGTPLPASDAVRQFLTALGVPAQRIPAGLDEQAALYRSELAGRQVLIVLDNARDAEQVRPLLPGAPGCLVLVTSRTELASLIAFEGAVPLTLDLLTHDEARDLLAAQRTAAIHAWHPVVWQLAWTLSTFHVRRGHRHDELAAWKDALKDAAGHPDPVTRALIHRFLGRAHADLGCHQEAIGHLHHALTLAEVHRDLTEQAHTHRTLAWAWERGGDVRLELDHATRALDLYRAVNRAEWEADALHMVGWCTARLGNYDAARAHCRTALSMHRKHHYPTGEADTLNSLGYIEHHTGHHQQAIDHYQQALALRRTIGNTYQSADTLDHLGHPHAALGQHEQARAIWRQALDLYQRQGRDHDAQRVQHKLNTLSVPGTVQAR
jgi:tetratricopeptide (TPR) repeat protein